MATDGTKFSAETGRLFKSQELTEYLRRALALLDADAEAGCDSAIPGSEITCGTCGSCTAAKFVAEVDDETERRRLKSSRSREGELI